MDRVNARHDFGGGVLEYPGTRVGVKGRFDVWLCDKPQRPGRLGRILRRLRFPNGSTTAGLNDLLSVGFNSGTQKTLWYFGLIDNAGLSSLAISDTIASHSGWVENTSYSESVRQLWTPSSPSSGSITNPTVATFTASSAISIAGLFLVSNSTKGGTTGILWAHGLFGSTQSLTSGQTLTARYTLTMG